MSLQPLRRCWAYKQGCHIARHYRQLGYFFKLLRAQHNCVCFFLEGGSCLYSCLCLYMHLLIIYCRKKLIYYCLLITPQAVMESRDSTLKAKSAKPQPRTTLTRQRGTRLKSNSRAFTCNEYNDHIYSVIGNGQNSKLFPLKSFVQNMQWLVKSASSSFSKYLSQGAKAKDFKIVLEDPRGRALVIEDSNTGHKAATSHS